MKKLLAITLTLVPALSLTACTGGGSAFSGVEPFRSSTAYTQTESTGNASQVTLGTSEQPDGKIDPALVGSWLYYAFTSPRNTSDPNLVTEGLYIFAGDGSYVGKFVNNNRTGYISVARHSTHEKGNRKLTDGKVVFTNITHSEADDIERETATSHRLR